MSIHLYWRNGRLSLLSDEAALAVDEAMKRPRCFREMKVCPQTGCDCQSDLKKPIDRTRAEQNRSAAFNIGDGTTVMVDPAENLRGKDG